MAKFKVGDRVTFTNDYGLAFKGKTIVGLSQWTWEGADPQQRYFYAPNDAPWYSVPESSLTLEQEDDAPNA
jgi:hypothetical protein